MANLNRDDRFGDSFEEMFRRIFAPARREVPGAPTDIEEDIQETEQARGQGGDRGDDSPRAERDGAAARLRPHRA